MAYTFYYCRSTNAHVCMRKCLHILMFIYVSLFVSVYCQKMQLYIQLHRAICSNNYVTQVIQQGPASSPFLFTWDLTEKTDIYNEGASFLTESGMCSEHISFLTSLQDLQGNPFEKMEFPLGLLQDYTVRVWGDGHMNSRPEFASPLSSYHPTEIPIPNKSVAFELHV